MKYDPRYPCLVNVHSVDPETLRDKIRKRVHVATEEEAMRTKKLLELALKEGEWVEVVIPLF